MTQNEIELRVRDVRERPNRHVAEVDRIGDSGICGSHSRLGEHLVGDVAQDHRMAQSRQPHRYVPGSTSGVEDAGDRNQTVVGLDPAPQSTNSSAQTLNGLNPSRESRARPTTRRSWACGRRPVEHLLKFLPNLWGRSEDAPVGEVVGGCCRRAADHVFV